MINCSVKERTKGYGAVQSPTSTRVAVSSVPIDAKFRRQSTIPVKQGSERSLVRHKKTSSDLNARLQNICNVYSNLVPSPPSCSPHSPPTGSSHGNNNPPQGPLITSFQSSNTRPGNRSIRTNHGTPRETTRPSSRVATGKLTINVDLLSKKKFTVPDSGLASPGALQRRLVTGKKLHGSASALALKHASPSNIIGSFVSGRKAFHGSAAEEASLSSQVLLNVKSLSYGKNMISAQHEPSMAGAAPATKKQIRIPVKLRLHHKSKQPEPSAHIRSLSEVGDMSGTKSAAQLVSEPAKISPLTPTSNSTATSSTKREEKLREYKNLISAAAAANAMKLKVQEPHPPGSPKNNGYRDLMLKIKETRPSEPTLEQEESPRSPKEDCEFRLPRRQNKLERAREELIKWIEQYKRTNKSHPNTTLEFYMVGRVLGKGAFGKVNLCLHKLSGRLIAMKSLHKRYLDSEHNRAKFQNEIALLRILRHKNVIRLYETFSSDSLLLIVIELCGGGDLLSYVRKRKKLSEPVARVAFKQVLDGLNHCHTKGIVHRDIKLDNILLNEVGDIKICDFGVSKQVAKGQKLKQRCGTPAYIAPEILRDVPYDGVPADIWSAGIVLYAMLYGNFPFRADNVDELEEQILEGKFSLPDTISAEARRLISRILSQDPAMRPSIEDILSDPWLQALDENIMLFSEEEIQTIKKEYNFKDRMQVQSEDEETSSVFTEHGLDTTEHCADEGLDVSKSVILAPFNSLEPDLSAVLEETKGRTLPRKIIKFKSKLREFNRRYERDNNSKLDNGVYVQPAINVAKTGTKAGGKERRLDKARQQGTSRLTKNIIRQISYGQTQCIGTSFLINAL